MVDTGLEERWFGGEPLLCIACGLVFKGGGSCLIMPCDKFVECKLESEQAALERSAKHALKLRFAPEEVA